eukprot:6482290-Amphidinium_carterae.2
MELKKQTDEELKEWALEKQKMMSGEREAIRWVFHRRCCLLISLRQTFEGAGQRIDALINYTLSFGGLALCVSQLTCAGPTAVKSVRSGHVITGTANVCASVCPLFLQHEHLALSCCVYGGSAAPPCAKKQCSSSVEVELGSYPRCG